MREPDFEDVRRHDMTRKVGGEGEGGGEIKQGEGGGKGTRIHPGERRYCGRTLHVFRSFVRPRMVDGRPGRSFVCHCRSFVSRDAPPRLFSAKHLGTRDVRSRSALGTRQMI